MKEVIVWLMLALQGCAVARAGQETGCGGAPSAPERACLRVGDATGTEAYEEIEEAVRLWNEAVPELDCDVAISSDDANVLVDPDLLFTFDEEDELYRAQYGFYNDGIIYLALNAARESGHNPVAVAAHELGHFFTDSGVHHNGDGVMAATTGELADTVTQDDVDWYYEQ